MNIIYIDCILFFLLLFICLILYDPLKIITILKKYTLYYEKFSPFETTYNILNKQQYNILNESKNDLSNNILNESKNDIDKIFNPEAYNETKIINENNNDFFEEYIKIYKPTPLELENKIIRGHNYNKLDIFPKIKELNGNLPLKNNEFSYAMADGYIFKDSSAI